MELSKQDGRDVIYGDHPDWDTVEECVEDTSRWSIHHSGIFLHKPTSKHYSICWSVGATEMQDEQAFEHSAPEPVEVEAKEVITYEWVKK